MPLSQLRKGSTLATDCQLEHTIEAPLSFSGVGLHSGAAVQLRLVPAPAGSGIVFRRSDLDNFEIPATGRNVAKVSYATSLMRQGVLIQTTEHLLSALIGLGVDNVIAEIDNLELPILDGSANPYVTAILGVGRKQQRRKREYLRILKPVEVHDGSKFIGVYPGDGYAIDYTIDFPSPIGRDRFTGDLEADAYAELIAPARTFGFREDEAMLRNMGLIRGVSDDAAIILTRGGVQNGPLRFPDEFRAAQGAGPDRRPGPRRSPALGQSGRRTRRSCHAHGAGATPAAGPQRLAAGDAPNAAFGRRCGAVLRPVAAGSCASSRARLLARLMLPASLQAESA